MSLLDDFAHLQIPLEDVLNATNNFADKNFIKHGGFGKIYKGKLFHHGEFIDIVARKLDGKYGMGSKEFWTEISMLSSLNHPNLVCFIGFCDENDIKIIVNKYEANGSLDRFLSANLTWIQRLKICVGVARAPSYIHYDEARDFSVVHCNIKSSKILLDDNWQPKLSGFALSLKSTKARRHRLLLAPPCGTIGYVDPKYIKSSSVTHKSDIYSLGVVFFEVLYGIQAFIKREGLGLLAPLAKSNYEDGTLDDMINQGLRKQMDPESYKIFSETAYCCLKDQRGQRPPIDQIVYALDKALKLQLKSDKAEVEVTETETDSWKVVNSFEFNTVNVGKNLDHLKIKLHDIQLATEYFAEKYWIESDGYSEVYKAELEHFDNKNFISIEGKDKCELPKRRSFVALKRIIKTPDNHQGERVFNVEIETLSNCKHRNIVTLLGFCVEIPEMIIVYELPSNGSLDDYLGTTVKMTNLTWVQHIKICFDIAQGLNYIHTSVGDKPIVIHRDIKSENILLNEKWEAMICDFGLSFSYQSDQLESTLDINMIVGTQVYLDPEYAKTGRLRKASDIYSFGVVLFEMFCGRLAYDPLYTMENSDGLAPTARLCSRKSS
ncbi:probable receptor-like protein kinase At2g39360 [Rutidosis leptorrhynchoides]|uniref:probable receptor-like protein kinase At2g39360 n=1 Tax=Rutidosis leptorrhynchoides TaxID=125765 RepID=UPI003A9A6275